MAGYACQFGEENSHGASILITFLDNGATITLCPEHMSPALINLIAVDLGCDPERFYAGVQRVVANEAKRQEREAAKGTPDTDPDGAATGTGELTPDGGGEGPDDPYDPGYETPPYAPEPVAP